MKLHVRAINDTTPEVDRVKEKMAAAMARQLFDLHRNEFARAGREEWLYLFREDGCLQEVVLEQGVLMVSSGRNGCIAAAVAALIKAGVLPASFDPDIDLVSDGLSVG